MDLTQHAWMLWGLTSLGLVALGLIGCLFLFSVANAENVRMQRRLESEKKQLAQDLESFRESLSALRTAVEDAERHPVTSNLVTKTGNAEVQPVTPAASIDSHKRGQALRRYRHGETAETIATALQLPQEGVKLLLKVEEALLHSSPDDKSAGLPDVGGHSGPALPRAQRT